MALRHTGLPEFLRRNFSGLPLPFPVLEHRQVQLEQGGCRVHLQAGQAGVQPLSQMDLLTAEAFLSAKLSKFFG